MVKRAFSMQDLQGGIAVDSYSDSSTVDHVDTPASPPESMPCTAALQFSTMRRSKSMNALDENCCDTEDELSKQLPSIATLGLSLSNGNLHQVHGLEVLKRSAQETRGGTMSAMPRSLSNSSLTQLSQLNIQDDDVGAATALLELCSAGNNKSKSEDSRFEDHNPLSRVESAPSAPAVALPSLRELLGPSSGPSAGAVAGKNHANMYRQNERNMVWDEHAAAMLGAQMQAYQQLASASSKSKHDSAGHGGAVQTPSPAVRSPQHVAAAAAGDDAEGDGKHNKYCHFCQHVKVKRATSMLACENTECARRFCEHCLKTHFNTVTPSDGKSVHELIDGKWSCPICRKVCCCAIQSCENKHRHCKAYRYRQRRAEQAAKRTMATENSRSKPAPMATMHSGEGHIFSSPSAAAAAQHAKAAHAQQWAGFGSHSGAYSAAQMAAVQEALMRGAGHKGMAQGLPQHMHHMAASHMPMHHMAHGLQGLKQLQGLQSGAPVFEFQGHTAMSGDAGLQTAALAAVGVAGPKGLTPLGMPTRPTYLHFH